MPNSLRLAPAALVAAALILVGTVGYLSMGLPDSPKAARSFAATDFNFVMGSGTVEDDFIVVGDFDDGHALLTSGPVSLEANDFRFLTMKLSATDGDGFQTIFWRRSDAPDDLIQWRFRETGTSIVDLSAATGWNGEISEFGFLLRERNGGTVAIGPVRFESDSLTWRLRLTWETWTAFERWTQKSVNFLQGGDYQQPVRLPVLAIAWIFLTLMLAWSVMRYLGIGGTRELMVSGAVVFVAAWMILDLRWTANNLRQTQRTLDGYRGTSEEQRLGSGLDGGLYRYILQLRRDVLPAQPARILILGDEYAVEYHLQRAKYHLLPHSAYATRRIPHRLTPDAVDYVIFFGGAGGIERAPGWNHDWQDALTRKHGGEWGEVYAVAP